MDNTFNTDKHYLYNQILEGLKIPFIDHDMKKSKLWKSMGDTAFLQMEEEILNNPDNSQAIYLRYMRQYGTPFKIKKRKINLSKYNLVGDGTFDTNHYGIHFDNKGTLFHFLPNGINFGPDEYNKEICSYDWISINNKPFFTLMSVDEIKQFCKKWDKKIKYKFESLDSELFVEVLAYWLQ